MIDGLAQRERVNIEEQVTNMIRRGETLIVYAEKPEYKKRFDDTLGNPAVKLLLGRFRSHLEKTEEEIRASMPWWVERIRETRPELCSVISREPDGVNWLGTIFIDIVHICRRYVE
jgi:hypothetical protein